MVVAVDALSFLAQAWDVAWLRDVAVNAGPIAVAGGAGAGGAAAGGSPESHADDPYVPPPTTMYDPRTGTTRDPSWYERLTWEIGRRIEGLPTGEEIHNQTRSEYHDRMTRSMTETIPDDPPAEPTTPYGDPLDEPPDPADGSGTVQHADPPATSHPRDRGPAPGAGGTDSGGSGGGAGTE